MCLNTSIDQLASQLCEAPSCKQETTALLQEPSIHVPCSPCESALLCGCRGSEMAGLAARTAAWRMLQLMYDLLSECDVREEMQPALGCKPNPVRCPR